MPETPAEIVIDASVAVRGLTSDGEAAALYDAVASGEIAAHAPELIVAEVSNALAVAVRTERRALDDAQALLGAFVGTRCVLHSTTLLAPAALALAAELGISAYDALYATLASALDIPLATADRALADAVPGVILVG